MKNRAAILLLFTANAISGVAQGISMIAIPWYFARLPAMSQFGWLYWGATLLSILWVPVCGMWVDKYDRKRLFLVLNLVCGALVGAVSVWGMASGMLPWYAVGFVFVVTFFNYNLHYPALYAFAQEITEPVFYGRITSLLEIVQQSISVLAGAAAAVLLEGWGSQTLRLGDFVWMISPLEPWPIYRIFSVDAVTYFASFLLILGVKYEPVARRIPEAGNLVFRIKTGVLWLKNHLQVLVFGIASHSVFAVVMVVTFYLNANYVRQHLSESGDVFAASEMFFAFGAVLAGALTRRLWGRVTIPVSIVVMTLVVSAGFGVLFATRSVVIFYGCIFLLGWCNAGVRIQRVTWIFQKIPNQVIGRTGSVFRVANILVRALFIGMFSFAFFHGGHIIWAYLIMGVFLAMAAGVLWGNECLPSPIFGKNATESSK